MYGGSGGVFLPNDARGGGRDGGRERFRCSLLFLIENHYIAMVLLLRRPAFLILAEGGGGGRPRNETGARTSS